MIITAVYLGTVRSRHDALWQKKEQLDQLQAADGRQRVFWAGPQLVTAANPQYGRFLQDQVARYGRHNPIIASEYYLEPLESGGGLFPPRRIALMQGHHPRQRAVRLLSAALPSEIDRMPVFWLPKPSRRHKK